MVRTLAISGWGTHQNGIKNLLDGSGSNSTIEDISWWKCFGNNDQTNQLIEILSNASDCFRLIGWSTGGMIALSAAARFPEKIKKLVLISSTARFTETDNYPGVAQSMLRAMIKGLRLNPQKMLYEFLKLSMLPAEDDILTENQMSDAERIDTGCLKEGLQYLKKFDERDVLFKIKCPVLLIHGEKDRIVPLGHAEFLNKRIESSRLSIIRGIGHRLPFLTGNLLLDKISRFMNENAT